MSGVNKLSPIKLGWSFTTTLATTAAVITTRLGVETAVADTNPPPFISMEYRRPNSQPTCNPHMLCMSPKLSPPLRLWTLFWSSHIPLTKMQEKTIKQKVERGVTVVRTKVWRITFSGAANFTAKVPNINGVKSTSWQHLSMKIVDNLLRHLIPVKLALEHKHLCSLLTRKQQSCARRKWTTSRKR